MTETQRLLRSARDHHRAGRLREAEPLYRQILSTQPDCADALHLLGVLMNQLGRTEEAVDLIERAIARDPASAAYHANLGLALTAADRLEEAADHHRRALELQPDQPSAWNNLGTTLHRLDKLTEAAASLQRALELKPDYAAAHNNLALVYKDQGRSAEAEASFTRALEIRPEYPQAQNNLANLLMAEGRSAEAIACYRKATALQPDYAVAHRNLAVAWKQRGQIDEAVRSFEKARQIDPNDAEAWDGLGSALSIRGDGAAAVSRHEQAIKLQPQRAAFHNNLSQALKHLGRLDEAEASLRRALEIDPNSADAHWNHALIRLLRGDFARGWDEYEWRWSATDLAAADQQFDRPLWDGSELAGRTIVVWEEQGLGDTIQFIRYVNVLAEFGGRVIARVHPRLHRLLRTVEGIAEMVGLDEDLPTFDCHAPLLSLPRLVETRRESIPGTTRYLRAEVEQVERWRARLSGVTARIGLCWQGSRTHGQDRLRSLALDRLAPLLTAKDTAFVILQKGIGREQVTACGPGSPITDFGDELDAGPDAFVDTAAIIENLDLVITVDTAVAHVAGALGKPTWVLLHHVPDWRWMLEREDSPWYPSLRLFRQPVPHDWDAVVARVAGELKATFSRRQE